MTLIEALGLKFQSIISLVGAGGKTSFIFTLAREASALGKSVLVTTTTAMFNPAYKKTPVCSPHRLVIGSINELITRPGTGGTITMAARNLKKNEKKLEGYSPKELSPVLTSSCFDLVLIEADGAKMRPIKAPADHEPVIPSQTDLVVGCIGLDCLGTPLESPWVHRPEHLAKLSGQDIGTLVTPATLTRLATSKTGIFKSVEPKMKKVLVLNKADTTGLVQQGKATGRRIIPHSPADLCLVTSFKYPDAPVRIRIFGPLSSSGSP